MRNATIVAAIDERTDKGAQHKTAAEVLMLVTTFCWASNIVAGKEALQGFGPLALAQLRMTLAALLFGAMFLLWRGWPRLHLTQRQWLFLGLMGFTGITLNQICFLGGLARTSVTHTGLIQAVGPIMVLLLSALIGREVLMLRNCVGMAIAFTGVAVLLTDKSGSENGAHWSGDVILLAAGTSFALYTILMKDVTCDYDALTLSMLVFALGVALLTPFCLRSVAAVEWAHVSLRAWAGLAYMVVFGSVVAYLIYAFALSVLSASKAAAFAYLQPVMAVGLGVWLIGERVTAGEFAGGALILLGVYLTEQQQSKQPTVRCAAGAAPTGKIEIETHGTDVRGPCTHRVAPSVSLFRRMRYSQVSAVKGYCPLILAPLDGIRQANSRLAICSFRNGAIKNPAGENPQPRIRALHVARHPSGPVSHSALAVKSQFKGVERSH